MRPFHRKKKSQNRFYLLNFRIPYQNLRIIDENSQQLGILKKEEALKLAQEKGLDLVLIAPNANPPVAKVIDFKKFLYQENKKKKEAKKGIKKGTVKDIKLSLFIGPADLNRLIEKGKNFLNEGYQLRINLPLKGRENMKKNMAFDLVNKFIQQLGEVNIAKPPKFEGQILRTVVFPKK